MGAIWALWMRFAIRNEISEFLIDCQWDLMVGNDGDKEMEEGSKWLSKDPKGIWVMQTMYLTIVKWSRKHMSIICYLRF